MTTEGCRADTVSGGTDGTAHCATGYSSYGDKRFGQEVFRVGDSKLHAAQTIIAKAVGKQFQFLEDFAAKIAATLNMEFGEVEKVLQDALCLQSSSRRNTPGSKRHSAVPITVPDEEKGEFCLLRTKAPFPKKRQAPRTDATLPREELPGDSKCCQCKTTDSLQQCHLCEHYVCVDHWTEICHCNIRERLHMLVCTCCYWSKLPTHWLDWPGPPGYVEPPQFPAESAAPSEDGPADAGSDGPTEPTEVGTFHHDPAA